MDYSLFFIMNSDENLQERDTLSLFTCKLSQSVGEQKARMFKFIFYSIISISFLSACSKQVDEAADTGYHYTQGRIDKAKKTVSEAEEAAKKRAGNASDVTTTPVISAPVDVE